MLKRVGCLEPTFVRAHDSCRDSLPSSTPLPFQHQPSSTPHPLQHPTSRLIQCLKESSLIESLKESTLLVRLMKRGESEATRGEYEAARPRYSYASSRHMLLLLTSCHYHHHMSTQDICWSYAQDICMLEVVPRGMLLLPRALLLLLVTTSSTPPLPRSLKGSYLT